MSTVTDFGVGESIQMVNTTCSLYFDWNMICNLSIFAKSPVKDLNDWPLIIFRHTSISKTRRNVWKVGEHLSLSLFTWKRDRSLKLRIQRGLELQWYYKESCTWPEEEEKENSISFYLSLQWSIFWSIINAKFSS